MKKLILSILILFITVSVCAQRPTPERIRAQKVAFITNQLDLSALESQKFWPIYNTYEATVSELRKSEMRDIRQKMRNGGGSLSNSDADNLLQRYLDFENSMYQAKVTLINNLKSVISAKKILKLKAAEEAFNKKLLELLKNRREQIQNRQKRN